MDIEINLLEGQKVEASFNGFKIVSDQPVENKGDNSAPSPFDYFMASTAMCAGFFVKSYCNARGLPAEKIKLKQKSIKSPENKYKYQIEIYLEVPEDFSEKDRAGLIRAIEGCSVKKAINEIPEFAIKLEN